MYRPHHNESRAGETTYYEESPFFRETVSLIDECSKLPKDDRIVLRNKMKEYLRGIRQNRLTENQEQMDYYNQLIQIFIEANKKKPLSKIQKGDKAMDWLQIKLRKFMDFNKKEKHRRQLQNFRKGKFVDYKHSKELPSKQMKSRGEMKSKRSQNQKEARQILGASRGSNLYSKSKPWMPSSLSRSRQKEPLLSSRKKEHHQSYAHYSYHQNFSFLKKNNQPNNTSLQKQHISNKRASNLNRSLETFGKANRSVNTSKGKTTERQSRPVWNKWTKPQPHKFQNQKQTKQPQQNQTNQIKPMQRDNKEQQISQQEISRLTKLFSQQLNSETHREPASYRQFNQQFSMLDQQMRSHPNEMTSQATTHREQPQSSKYDSLIRYEQSTKKIQEMLQGSKALLNQISSRRQYAQENEEQPATQPTGTFMFPAQVSYQPQSIPEINQQLQIRALNPPSKSSYDEIFTPPDFLAQCRKIIESSNKKLQKEQKEEQTDKPAVSGVAYQSQMTFSDLLSNSREKNEQKFHSMPFHFDNVNINEVVSENVSAGLSTQKEESKVVSNLKGYLLRTPEDLLLDLFGDWHQTSMDRFQLGQLMTRCNVQTQRLLQKYCEILEKETVNSTMFRMDFVAVLKYFYSCGGVFREEDGHFSYFLCSILDMQKNGYIYRSQIDNFIESMECSQIEDETLNSIRQLLIKIFEKGCRVEGASDMITRWSLYYLQLTNDASLCQLRELLNRFEFQVDDD